MTYAETLEELSLDAAFKEYRTLRHRLAWILLTPPDVCSTAYIASQVVVAKCSEKHLRFIDKFVRHAKETKQNSL